MHTHTPEFFSRWTDQWKPSKEKESNKAVSGWRLKGVLHSKNLIYEAQARVATGVFGAMVTQWTVRSKGRMNKEP